MLIRHLLFIVIPLSLFISCNKEVDEPVFIEENKNIRFEISIAPTTRVATDANYKSTWETGDAIGLFAVDLTPPGPSYIHESGNYIHNVRLTYREIIPGDPATGLWFPDEGAEITWLYNKTLNFFAYYPYDNKNGNPAGFDPTNYLFTVSSDQQAKTLITLPDGTQIERNNFNLTDLLLARATGNYVEGNPVLLQFSHSLAMIEATLYNTGGMIDPDYELSVSLPYIQPTAIVDLSGSDNTPGYGVSVYRNDSPANIKMYRVEQPGDANYTTHFTFRALLPAQEIPAGNPSFRIVNGNLRVNVPDLTVPLVLEAGKITRVRLNVD